MKFIKSSVFKKIVIMLIVIILFNALIPPEVKAWDLAGILMKPLSSLILVVMVSIDATLGVFLTAADMVMNGVGDLIAGLCSGNDSISINGETILADKILVGPDTIFSGQVGILNANIFEANVNTTGIIQNSNVMGSIKKGLAETYVVLRNVCAIIMLAGLIFTGIRILVSSNIPTKRTQWLMILQDWLIGMVLLVFSHIIMIGIFYVSDTLVNALRSSMVGSNSNLNWELVKECFASFDSAQQVVCLVMLGYLIYLTVIFAISYFKRLMWVCVLIVIAPIVSIMYAFGNQTKQIYSKWIREFMMTVLVQPFHMIIYYTLFSVPLNMTGSTGFTLGTNFFTLIYALGAISFIRPAEKYVRELFGMHQGIANMASYDSGKQTFDAIKNAIEDVIKKVVMVAGIALTGGAAAAIAPAMGAAAGAGGAAAAEGAGATAALGAGEGTAGGALEGMNLLGTPESSLIDAGLSGPTDPVLDQYSSEGFGQNTNGEYFNPWTDEYDASYDPHKDLSYNPDYDSELEKSIDDNSIGDMDSTNEATEKLKGEQINAANVTITAGNVNMQGQIENVQDTPEDSRIRMIENSEEDNNNDNGDDNDSDNSDETTDYNLQKNNSLKDRLMSGISKARDIGLTEELRGLKNEGKKGLNSVRDTFYVTAPPQDWKGAVDREDKRIKANEGKRKEGLEAKKNIFIKDDSNKQYIIEQKKYMEMYGQQYPDKSEAYIRQLAEDRAEKDLTKLADSFIPYGIDDVSVAYALSQDQKKYGLSTEQAIRQKAEFDKFNINQQNVITANNVYHENNNTVSETMPDAKEYFNNGYRDVGDMAQVSWLRDNLNIALKEAMKIDKVLRNKGQINCSPKKDNETQEAYNARKRLYNDINEMYKRRGDK